MSMTERIMVDYSVQESITFADTVSFYKVHIMHMYHAGMGTSTCTILKDLSKLQVLQKNASTCKYMFIYQCT